MIEKIETSTKILKLNLQHFADAGVSGIAIGDYQTFIMHLF